MSRAAENHLRACAPVAILSDKWEIIRLFAFDRIASNYSTNIVYTKTGQYSNFLEFKFELCYIPIRFDERDTNTEYIS